MADQIHVRIQPQEYNGSGMLFQVSSPSSLAVLRCQNFIAQLYTNMMVDDDQAEPGEFDDPAWQFVLQNDTGDQMSLQPLAQHPAGDASLKMITGQGNLDTVIYMSSEQAAEVADQLRTGLQSVMDDGRCQYNITNNVRVRPHGMAIHYLADEALLLFPEGA